MRGDFAARFVGIGRRDIDAVFHPLRDEHGKAIGVSGFGVDVTDRKRDQAALAESRDRLEFLTRQLITTQEAERQKLVRELHDEIGQDLTAMRISWKTAPAQRDRRLCGLSRS